MLIGACAVNTANTVLILSFRYVWQLKQNKSVYKSTGTTMVLMKKMYIFLLENHSIVFSSPIKQDFSVSRMTHKYLN